MPVLSFQCHHRYRSGFDLEISFEIDRRFTSLFGPSGSGKTSVLGIISGLLRPQQGSVRLGDRTLLDTARGIYLPPEARGIGMVFQDSLLFPHLTVERNLRYGCRRRLKHHRQMTLGRVADVLEIGSLLHRYPRNLSGGERQRVALGRAILSGPDLLVMDEPLASLDDPLKGRVLAYLQRAVAEWDIPTLYVTHGQAEVRRAAAWVVVIEKGRLVGAGPPEEALSQPAPLGWANSTGPVNLLRIDEIAVQGDHVVARVGGQNLFLPLDKLPGGTAAFVQFRPADVILSRRDVAGLSARNYLHGRVCRVLAVQSAVFVAIDMGQILWAEITPQAAAELNLEPGTEVTCVLKAHNLTLVD